ncbi:RagB/SusD family nutrient uptake outer membrane protein [Pedobacter hiemivivus]|uniref:RagB/SusD family nutrient uptake outer membrane protein n=1 Tax=Pedobacter hiemivivus TaxID=2530454 RepID=A0A4R0NGQ9_9SPHI|nr:RagB/SusD family nutrient uptake outer membrane protein [Pedobacter hiemivivus]TCC98463.1 RagB/SusD family nutrient uptake outer membrane protein [Pedobacter hiemivivus]
MKIFNLLLAIGCIMVSQSSCKKYLDIKPKGIIIAQTITDYEGLLNSNTVANPFGTLPVLINPSDDLTSTSYSLVRNDDPSSNVYFWKSYITDLNSINTTMWSEMYRCIANLNVVTEGVMSATGGTEEKKRQYFAEALAAKSFCYYNLLIFFSPAYMPATASNKYGVPYVVTVDQGTAIPLRPTLKACLEQITGDLLNAIPNLPNEQTFKTRIDKYGGYAMLSRFYLYMHDYVNALKYANLALTSPKASIVDYNQYLSNLTLPATNVSPEELLNRFSGAGTFTLSKDLNARLIPSDLRWRILVNNPTAPRFNTSKYRPNLGISWAEVFLNKAECLARSGDISGALTIVNETIRKKRFDPLNYHPLTANSSDEAITAVLNERRIELMFRGVRWGDMKRLDAEGRMSSVKRFAADGVTVLTSLEPKSENYTFQIPLIVQQFNPGIPLN